MKFYFAPMEGLTGYIYRNAHHACFNHIDKYFCPFIPTNEGAGFKKRETDELAPENNQGLIQVPQLLSNNAKDFILMADKINRMGYDEINLNLGCPSGTVVAKNKGAGFLAKTAELDEFLYEIFSWGKVRVSLKTRLGKENPDEFFELMEIFNKYPVEELIIHPRIQKDFYKNKPKRDYFKYAMNHSKSKLCYNGDIFTAKQFRDFCAEFPDVGLVMLGRGLLVNPGLVKELTDGVKIDKNTLREFHDKVYSGYRKILSGDMTILYRMKEIWIYLICMFSDNEKYAKRIRKAVKLADYENVVSSLFRERELLEDYESNLGGI